MPAPIPNESWVDLMQQAMQRIPTTTPRTGSGFRVGPAREAVRVLAYQDGSMEYIRESDGQVLRVPPGSTVDWNSGWPSPSDGIPGMAYAKKMIAEQEYKPEVGEIPGTFKPINYPSGRIPA